MTQAGSSSAGKKESTARRTSQCVAILRQGGSGGGRAATSSLNATKPSPIRNVTNNLIDVVSLPARQHVSEPVAPVAYQVIYPGAWYI